MRSARRLRIGALIYAGTASSDKSADAVFSSYGFSKSLAEQLLAAHGADFGYRFVSLRFPQIFDTKGLCCTHQPWFGRIVAYASRGLDLRMPASLGPRNFLHVEDAAEAMVRAADTDADGILPMSNPESLTCDEIAALAYGTFEAGGHPIIAPEKTPFRAFRFPDSSETLAALSLRPRSMQEGFEGIRVAGTAGAFGPMDVS